MAQQPEVATLLELDRHDREIARLDDEVRYLERLLERERERVAQVEQSVAEARERARALQRRLDALELDARSAAERRTKLQVQQNQAKTNEEYAALARQIEALGREISDKEDETLAGFEQQEALEAEIARLEQELATARQQLAGEQQRLEGEIATIRARRDKEAAARARALERLGNKTRAMYERVLAKVGGRAIAEVESGMCRGCYLQLPTHLFSMVVAGHEIVCCPQCARFLYVPSGTGPGEHSFVAGGERGSPMPGD